VSFLQEKVEAPREAKQRLQQRLARVVEELRKGISRRHSLAEISDRIQNAYRGVGGIQKAQDGLEERVRTLSAKIDAAQNFWRDTQERYSNLT
jgi:hypothetical protein